MVGGVFYRIHKMEQFYRGYDAGQGARASLPARYDGLLFVALFSESHDLATRRISACL